MASKDRQREKWAADELLCNSCGSRMSDKAFKTCDRCRDQTSERLNRHLMSTPRAPQKLSAQALSKRRSAASIRKSRKASSGICFVCRQPKMQASRYCKAHWLDNTLRRYGFGRHQHDAMWAKLEAQEFRCYYSGVSLVPGVNASLDHLIPRSRGGDPTDEENCVWCDRLMNSFKNDLTEAEFVERCKAVADRLG